MTRFFRRTRGSRRVALLAAAMTAALTLAGCGSGAETEQTSGAAAASSENSSSEIAVQTSHDAAAEHSAPETAAPADTAYPIVLPTAYGDVTLPARPERVVALTVAAADTLISLGVQPVAVATDPAALASTFPWMVGQIDDVADASLVSPAGEVNLEAVAQTKPDLIVGATYLFADAAEFGQINQIAPTVIANSTALNVDWDQRLTDTAAAFGLADEAQSIIDGIRADFAEVGSKVPGVDSRTYQFVRVDPDGYGFGNGSVLELFGLKPAANQDNTQNGPVLSKENTAQLDADLLGVWAPTDDLRAGLDKDPLFQALPAVENGTVFYADLPMAFAANTPAPMALGWLKDRITPSILALG